MVDHENRNTLDDRIENLRPSIRSQNNGNSTSSKNSASKYLGVSKSGRYWRASMSQNNKYFHIGTFKLEAEAALAYNREAIRYHKDFANLNIIQPY